MVRTICTLAAAALLSLPGPARPAGDALAGNWKVLVTLQQDEPQPFWIISFEADKDGKWTGKVLDTTEGLRETTLEGLTVAGDLLRFTLKLKEDSQTLSFEGKLPKDGAKTVLGTIEVPGGLALAQLDPTELKDLKDAFELNKDTLAKNPNHPKARELALGLLAKAGAKKAKPEEVRSWANQAYKLAEPYGPRYQRDVALRIAETLTKQEGFAGTAVEYAKKVADKLLEENDKAGTKLRVWSALAAALRKADKADEAKEFEAKRNDLFKVTAEKFPGRKGQSTRALLVETFTDANYAPSLAADLAVAALGQRYQPSEVICVNYHLPVEKPGPLAGPDNAGRIRYYARSQDIQELPAVLVNGKLRDSISGGSLDDKDKRYKDAVEVIDPLLEEEAGAKIKLTAMQKGNEIKITAEASDYAKPGEQLRLRLVLVEKEVSYAGANMLPKHRNVVRDFPGGAEGVALTEKTGKQTTTVDLEALKKKLSKFLDGEVKDAGAKGERPLELKNLCVVAFVQNDTTKEVLQAAQVDVRAE